MNYQTQCDKVIAFIGQHIDEDLTLDQLSDIACFSKYHFHRLFTAFTGLSLQQYIRWLRLKRAAHQLVIEEDTSIINIAINAGFNAHESFSRVFKQVCGMSPSQFRAKPNWLLWELQPYCLPTRGQQNMKVTIQTLTERRLAAYTHRGDIKKLGDSINKLISWAKAQASNLTPKPGEAFGFAYDDPKTTKPEEFRYDIAITVPNHVKIDGEMIEKRLSAGRYATAVHRGSRESIGDTVYGLYRDWLPDSGEELAELPCLFRFFNFEHEVAETELTAEVCLLLKN